MRVSEIFEVYRKEFVGDIVMPCNFAGEKDEAWESLQWSLNFPRLIDSRDRYRHAKVHVILVTGSLFEIEVYV